jgi:hypothetical protein
VNLKPIGKSPRFFAYAGSLIVAGFYLLSTAGWFLANYLALSGELGEGSLAEMHRHTLVDVFVRVAQVVVISLASILLILRRALALPLFIAILLLSLLCTVFIEQWGISFLAGIVPILLLVGATLYVYWQVRVGLLK